MPDWSRYSKQHGPQATTQRAGIHENRHRDVNRSTRIQSSTTKQILMADSYTCGGPEALPFSRSVTRDHRT
ncbi:hypothetical protein PAXRUDRAFT_829316, partial [Paxillus rubicundulus Ve08.2h10]